MRKFDGYTDEKKINVLMGTLGFALTATDEQKKQTPIYQLAASFGRMHGLTEHDYGMIKHHSVDELVTKSTRKK